jgi:large subunit ribosomal protein L17
MIYNLGFFNIMNKSVYGRKLKRDKNERKALFKSLMSALVMNERIQTSEAKAKAIRPEIERLITKAKKGGNSAHLVIEKSLTKDAFTKLVNELGSRFEKRAGGYTRLIRLGERFGDNSPVVVMEFTESAAAIVPVQTEKELKGKKEKKVEKKTVVKESIKKVSTDKKSNSTKSRKAGVK